MRVLGAVPFLLVLLFAVACAGEASSDQPTATPARILVGQLLLPSGSGSRGVEVRVRVAAAESEAPVVWVLFDEHGRFSHEFRSSPVSVVVMAGTGHEVFRTDDLPEANRAGQIDVGVIDLRDRLMRHRVLLSAAEGKPSGMVRMAMWRGPPPVGPQGEPVSLGSRQFPPVALGSEVEWLIPYGAEDIYFLVERRNGSREGGGWRSGHQRLFGPFTEEDLPAELGMD